jgi:hypothetical protein
MISSGARLGVMMSAIGWLSHSLSWAQTAGLTEATPDDLAGPSTTSSIPFPAAPQRHRGLYLGAHLGLGELRFTVDDYSFWGRSTPVEVWAGISILPDLILFGEFYDAHVLSPSSTYGEVSRFHLLGAGLGARYYLTPANLYVSASFLLSRLGFHSDEVEVLIDGTRFDVPDPFTRWGASGRFAFGKEWRMSQAWWLGLAGDVLFGRMKFIGFYPPNGTGTAKGFSLLATAAYHPERDTWKQTSPAGYHEHDGFYVGARLGVAWLKATRNLVGGSVLGWGVPFALSAGFALTRSWVLFGEFYQAQVRHPSSDYFGELADLELVAVGPGVTFYLLPHNVSASASFSLSKVGFRSARPMDTRYGTSVTSHWGVTGRLSLGKEWWVSSDWGVGFAAEALLGRMPGGELNDEQFIYTVKGFALTLTASFN